MTSSDSASRAGVAVVQVDVVGGGGSGVQADGLPHHKGHCLGFGLAYGPGGCGAALGL